MPTNALIKTSSLSGYWQLVQSLGGSPDSILRQCHLNPQAVHNLDGVISHKAEINAVEKAAQALRCPDFGLKLAEGQDLYILGPVAAVALTASSVGDAIDRIIDRLHWFSPTANLRMRREVKPGQSLLLYYPDPSLPRYRTTLEHSIGVLRNIMRSLAGSRFRPQAVYFSFESPLPAQHYVDFFQAPVFFRQEQNALLVDSKILEQPLNPPSQRLHLLLRRYAKEILADNPLHLGRQVELLIENLLLTGNCNLETISGQLGYLPRTLQRELCAEGLSFESILDSTRRRLADTYLKEVEMPLVDIASLLGYSEQSTFSRACKRWFGCTPLQRRKQLAE
ncbi:AraC family transcriptional regulator [Microbulbifer guangxiensis]|uniref:AraC family transcriptional regulator n=1 Tax=Microbulbifer guangxiensis TaxID=2904249 RepID=UPI001F2F04D6